MHGCCESILNHQLLSIISTNCLALFQTTLSNLPTWFLRKVVHILFILLFNYLKYHSNLISYTHCIYWLAITIRYISKTRPLLTKLTSMVHNPEQYVKQYHYNVVPRVGYHIIIIPKTTTSCDTDAGGCSPVDEKRTRAILLLRLLYF